MGTNLLTEPFHFHFFPRGGARPSVLTSAGALPLLPLPKKVRIGFSGQTTVPFAFSLPFGDRPRHSHFLRLIFGGLSIFTHRRSFGAEFSPLFSSFLRPLPLNVPPSFFLLISGFLPFRGSLGPTYMVSPSRSRLFMAAHVAAPAPLSLRWPSMFNPL